MEKGLSRERKPRDLGPSPAFCTEQFLKPVSPGVSSAVKMPAMLSNTATARINLQFPSLILCHGVESILFLISLNFHSIPRRKGSLSIPLFQMWKVRHRVVKSIVQWHLTQPNTLGQNSFNSDSYFSYNRLWVLVGKERPRKRRYQIPWFPVYSSSHHPESLPTMDGALQVTQAYVRYQSNSVPLFLARQSARWWRSASAPVYRRVITSALAMSQPARTT